VSCFRSYLQSPLISNLFVILDLDHRSSRNGGTRGMGRLATKRWVIISLICIDVLNPVEFECIRCFKSYFQSPLISNLLIISNLDRRSS
jgi:hypothetical protein